MRTGERERVRERETQTQRTERDWARHGCVTGGDTPTRPHLLIFSKTVLLTGDQAFKHRNLWEPFSLNRHSTKSHTVAEYPNCSDKW